MSSNKTKLLESAQKFFLKGQYDRAVYEYRQLIKLEPSDLRHRQKVAEILTKANQKDEAIKEYTSLAKIYVDSVHYLKAIAVYKQIQRIDPSNPETALTLATLNEKQGLIGNASAEYATAAQIYDKNGDNLKSLKVLESMTALDPSNTAVKLRLADKFYTTGSEDRSLCIFKDILTDLKEREDENGFSLIAERAINLFGFKAETFITELSNERPESFVPVSEFNQGSIHVHPDETSYIIEATEQNDDISNFDEEDIEVLEDLIPLDEHDEVDIVPEDDDEEWEEDIDLSDPEIHSYNVCATETFQATDEELDDLDLELEVDDDNDLASDNISIDDNFDLGSELSIFADEIDFKFFADESQLPSDESTSSGLKKNELDNEDTESHYSLGLAYKEMGLYDDAISEFIFASRSSERKIDSMILQSSCLREMGNIVKAVEILTDISNNSNLTADERLGLQYELALCYENMSEKDIAVQLFTEIVKEKPDFSDAGARLKRISKEIG